MIAPSIVRLKAYTMSKKGVMWNLKAFEKALEEYAEHGAKELRQSRGVLCAAIPGFLDSQDIGFADMFRILFHAAQCMRAACRDQTEKKLSELTLSPPVTSRYFPSHPVVLQRFPESIGRQSTSGFCGRFNGTCVKQVEASAAEQIHS